MDERGDIFACGIVMSDTFYGSLTFKGSNTMEFYQMLMPNEPLMPSARWPGISPELESRAWFTTRQ